MDTSLLNVVAVVVVVIERRRESGEPVLVVPVGIIKIDQVSIEWQSVNALNAKISLLFLIRSPLIFRQYIFHFYIQSTPLKWQRTTSILRQPPTMRLP